jgi:hypothetical protein
MSGRPGGCARWWRRGDPMQYLFPVIDETAGPAKHGHREVEVRPFP